MYSHGITSLALRCVIVNNRSDTIELKNALAEACSIDRCVVMSGMRRIYKESDQIFISCVDGTVRPATTIERQRIRQIQDAMRSVSDLQATYLDLFRLLVPLYFFDRDREEQFMAAARKESYHPQLAQLVQIDLLRNYNLHDPLRHFNPPVLIIQGHQDPMPEGVALDSKATLPNAQLLFFNESGHFPWLEQPEAFYKSLRTFLKTER